MYSNSISKSKTAIWFFATICVGVATVDAQASSCCLGSGGQSVCVLPREQQYQLGLSSNFKEISGSTDPYGVYNTNENYPNDWLFTNTMGVAYRFYDDWQANLSVPFVFFSQKKAADLTRGAVFADPVIEARYLIWDDLAFLPYRPELSVYAGMRLPFGDPKNVGEGVLIPHAGVVASKLYRPVKLSLDGTVLRPFGRLIDSSDVRPGERFQLSESATLLINYSVSASLGLRQWWALRTVKDDARVDGSAARSFATTLGVNYVVDSKLALGLSVETPMLLAGYLANQPGYYSAAINAVITGY